MNPAERCEIHFITFNSITDALEHYKKFHADTYWKYVRKIFPGV